MAAIDPSSGQPLPADAVQRILFIVPKVHVYNIPPMASTKGHSAASWTANNNQRQIFTARLRVLETAISSAANANPSDSSEQVRTDILLEDPSTGELFAAAPYNTPTSVEQAIDSSRFFAVRVVGEGGRKALLGIGFEERSDAVDFSITLQDVRKVTGMESGPAGLGQKANSTTTAKQAEKRDFSLKEGETITVSIGSRGRRSREGSDRTASGQTERDALFSIKPPPGSGGSAHGEGALPLLLSPPSTQGVKAERRRSRTNFPAGQESLSAEELGFDDGEFGEFQ